MEVIKSCALWACALVLISGCSSTPISAPAAEPAAAPSPAPQPARGAATAASTPATASSTVATVVIPEYLNPKSPLAGSRSVYFDFDDFSVKPEYSALLEQHGSYLSSHGSVAIKIEGNADERGGSEYNLALGQKRAQSVLSALKIYGVKEAQMEAISWGEERPRVAGHDEAAWAKNRRADLAYPAK